MAKKIIISVIIVIISSINFNLAYHKSYSADTVDSVINGAQKFIKSGQDKPIKENELKNLSKFIYNLLLAIAIIIAVIVGMILGIQFMTSSIEEKAKIKETLVPYVVSCVVVFGAFGIWRLAVSILSKW